MEQLSEETVTSWLKSNPHFLSQYLKGQLQVGPSTGSSGAHQQAWLDPHSGQGHGLKLSKKKSGCLRVLSETHLPVPVPADGATPKKSASQLRQMPKDEMLMELVRDIAHDLDINSLSHKILVNVNVITYADRSSLFLVEGDQNNTLLISRLFDVTVNSTVQESVHTKEEAIKIPLGVGIIGHAAKSGKPINIEDAYKDSRFNQSIDKKTGYRTRSILCMPIKNHLAEVIGVAQVMNKSEGSGVFSKEDEEIFANYLTFCGIGLTNARLYERSLREYNRNQVLLQLAHGLFEEQTSLERMVQRIMQETQELVLCEHCHVLLIDQEHKEGAKFNEIFCRSITPSGSQILVKKLTQNELPNMECAVAVVETGDSLNINTPDGPVKLDDGIRNLLCIPIYSNDEEVIGVAQMANKEKMLPFTSTDQESLEMFSAFCGLGIHNVLMYERIFKALAKQKVALEVLSYHAAAPSNEAERMANTPVPTAKDTNLDSFDFNDALLSDDETVLASVRMFLDCDLVTKFNIDYKILCRWIMTVKKNYRQVTYHNWRHAFNVAQTMFAMFKCGLMEGLFSDTEKLALLTACFCHDLDHRGTNNSFQSKVDSPIAQLYSTSTMEHHHFDHCIMILNSEGSNIFHSITTEEYSEVLKMLEHHILSTDLALYFQKKGRFIDIVEKHSFDWNNLAHRELLRSMLMTACDVAAITKPWEIQQEVAYLVASEFFEQGDRERFDLHLEPMAMMDRQKKDDLPKMQVGFIDAICMALYKELYRLHPPFQPLFDGVTKNRAKWQSLADEAGIRQAIEDRALSSPLSPAMVTVEGPRDPSTPVGGRPIEAWRSKPSVSHSSKEKRKEQQERQRGNKKCVIC